MSDKKVEETQTTSSGRADWISGTQNLRRINKERAFQQSRKSKKNVSGLSQQGVVCCVVDERRADRWLRKSF